MAFVGRTDVKDPGAQQHQWERLAQRRERLYAEDAQFSDARPDESVAESVRRPGLRIAEVLAVMDIYRQPAEAVAGSPVPGGQFAAAVEKSGLSIPRVSRELICKYLTDLKLIGVLGK